MKKDLIMKLTNRFEEAAHIVDGVECWMARDIQEILAYDEWRNFCKVVEKAKIACQKSKSLVDDHFVEANKMVQIGSEGTRAVWDMMWERGIG